MEQPEIASILLVDDQKENLLALEKLLAAPDLNIMKAASGNEALSLALEHDFALVLMDVQMPEMDGFETAELMRGAENTKHIPIIFVTAISKEHKHVFKGYESGAVDYLFKPLDPDILMAKVKMFLDIYRQKAALQQANESLREANRKILEQQNSIIEEERLKVLLQMAGATAHELNQPLMILLGSIEMMEIDREDSESMLAHAKNVKEAGERIVEIVKRIQTIRRHETKQYTANVRILQFDQKVRVLSVEDTLPDFLAIQSLLQEEAAIELHHAPDIETAFRELEEASYDLILIDYFLGKDTGEDFLKEAVKREMEIPIVVVTGKGNEMLASRMIQAGASGYLPKSELNHSTLTREIYQAMEKARLRKEVHRAQEKLAVMSAKDSLTDLYNRRYFEEALARDFSRAERHGVPFSVCIMDLDHFKTINDTYGHSAGDTVLRETARLLRSSFRKGDLVCRYGGEEFAAILHRTGTEEAQHVCETFRKTLASKIIEHKDDQLRVTVSIGIQSFDKAGIKSPEEMLDRADEALYKAKEAGRNNVMANKGKDYENNS